MATLCLAALAGLLAARPAQAAEPASPPPGKRFFIIAPAAFRPALAAYTAHKQTQLPTEFHALEEALAGTAGTDDPEKLKQFLYRAWRERDLGYVLLAGGAGVVPMRYMVLDRATPAAFDYAFYPSDLYYADLARRDGSFEDWNGHKEGFHAAYFGEVRGEKNKGDPINYDGIDYLPEIAVGRWPVATAAEAGRVAAKSIAWEEAAAARTATNARRAAFVATGGWVDSRALLNSLATRLAPGWAIDRRFYADPGRPATSPPPDHAQVRGLFETGAGLIVHTGHGAADGWDGCLGTRDLDRLTNRAACQPVIISAGCSTAYFAPLPPYEPYTDTGGVEHAGTDHGEVFTAPPTPPAPYQRGFRGTGLGAQLLSRNEFGGIAYIGCNTGSQPCALSLVEGFVNAVAAAPAPRLGDCWAAAIRHYYEREHLASLKPNADWYPPSIFFQGMKFMLFGDPTLPLPANHPQ